jgi:hypothetical protein
MVPRRLLARRAVGLLLLGMGARHIEAPALPKLLLSKGRGCVRPRLGSPTQ